MPHGGVGGGKLVPEGAPPLCGLVWWCVGGVCHDGPTPFVVWCVGGVDGVGGVGGVGVLVVCCMGPCPRWFGVLVVVCWCPCMCVLHVGRCPNGGVGGVS